MSCGMPANRTRAHVLVNTPNSRAVWGLIAGQKFDLGGIQLALGATDHNYAALIFTSLDGKPLETSHRILLTAVGSAENQGMVWNDSRTSVGNKWGTGPTLVNGISAEVTLPFRVKSVQALDGRGQPQGAVPVRVEGNTSRFTIGPGASHPLVRDRMTWGIWPAPQLRARLNPNQGQYGQSARDSGVTTRLAPLRRAKVAWSESIGKSHRS